MGTRDIIQWFSLSSVGAYKVIFLENIERMTISAANAFLKTFEEPLPNRIIIATTSNKDTLLDTIISRAFVIPFHTPSANIVNDHLASWYTEKTEDQRLFATSFSLGRVGLAKKLLETKENLGEMSTSFIQLLDLLMSPTRSVVKTQKLFQELQTDISPEQLIDALLYAAVQSKKYTNLSKLIHTRKMMQSNVNTDNVLFDLIIS